MRPRFLYAGMAILLLAGGGCSQTPTEEAAHVHQHDTASHMPSSLGDLCRKVRRCLAELKHGGKNSQLTNELTDLVSWTPEFAADTNIGEQLWIPIYQQSEQIRLSILKNDQQWDTTRIDQITQLCRLSEEAWKSLKPDERIARFQGHSHDDHGHSHGDHEHGDHEHGDHEHGDHEHSDHEHSDHDHSDHDHGDHDHGDHDHGDHEYSQNEQVTR